MGKAVPFEVERMRKDDIEQVLAIERQSFTMPWSRNLFLSEFRSPTVSTLLIAVPKGESKRTVAGYLVYWLVEDEMHILNLATAPGFRRQGCAKQLVLAGLSKAYAAGARRAFLEVRVSNSAAQKLYSALGFRSVHIRREYYDQPVEDAVVMVLEGQWYRDLALSERVREQA